MKILLGLIAIVFLAKDCKSNAQTVDSTTAKNDLEVVYTANTRGFYEYIKVTQESLVFSKDRDLNTVVTKTCPEKDWNEIITLLKKIDITRLETLEPPSKKFQFDGAPMATLLLNTTQRHVRTPIFDHGNPPKEIADLVTKVFTLKDKVLQN